MNSTTSSTTSSAMNSTTSSTTSAQGAAVMNESQRKDYDQDMSKIQDDVALSKKERENPLDTNLSAYYGLVRCVTWGENRDSSVVLEGVEIVGRRSRWGVESIEGVGLIYVAQRRGRSPNPGIRPQSHQAASPTYRQRHSAGNGRGRGGGDHGERQQVKVRFVPTRAPLSDQADELQNE
ncbi:hypothetical protein CPB86DRAFT_802642 [Serendipita vermifera]|nr:hypothetical protein CPB86DRAFT_802642 [Serendipita vermifera]